jgi:hypothetical protein
MDAQELKSLVDAGIYKPDPAQIATAMLERRGVRELLTGMSVTAAQDGRSSSAAVARPRAA